MLCALCFVLSAVGFVFCYFAPARVVCAPVLVCVVPEVTAVEYSADVLEAARECFEVEQFARGGSSSSRSRSSSSSSSSRSSSSSSSLHNSNDNHNNNNGETEHAKSPSSPSSSLWSSPPPPSSSWSQPTTTQYRHVGSGRYRRQTPMPETDVFLRRQLQTSGQQGNGSTASSTNGNNNFCASSNSSSSSLHVVHSCAYAWLQTAAAGAADVVIVDLEAGGPVRQS